MHRVVHGRKSVEPGIQQSLTQRNHQLDGLFGVKVKQMKRKPTKAEQENAQKGEVLMGPLDEDGCESVHRIGVSCLDVDELVLQTVRERGLNPAEVNILLGIDDGQGILKVHKLILSSDLINLSQVSIVIISKEI